MKKKEIRENPYKNHKHDGGSMYRDVDCFGCEKEMLWYFKNGSKLVPSRKE